MSQNQKKIFLVGFDYGEKFENCISYAWGNNINPVDFDIGFFNMAGLTKDTLTNIEESTSYLKNLKDLIQEVQVKKGFEVYCIYDKPRYKYYEIDSQNDIPENYSWLPVIPEFRVIAPFKTIKTSVEGNDLKKFYEEYEMDYIDNPISNTGFPTEATRGKFQQTITVVNIDNIVIKSSLDMALCFDLNWKISLYESGAGVIRNILVSKSPIHFLPSTPKVNEMVKFIISNIHKTKEPEWLESIQLEKEKKILADIYKFQDEISKSQALIESASRKLSIYKKPKLVLYETGKQLEKVTSFVFNELGIELHKPQNNAIEDRYFEIDGIKIYVETRGKEMENFKENDLRQLIERIADQPSHLTYPLRGIFVFNHERLTSPEKRSLPFQGVNISIKASTFGICLIDTVTLFKLYEAKMNGKLFDFKCQILNTVGIFDIANIKYDDTSTTINK